MALAALFFYLPSLNPVISICRPAKRSASRLAAAGGASAIP